MDPMTDRSDAGPRILIVDDAPENVRLLSRILERAGYTNVAGVSDPRLVPERVQADRPDLVIIDIHMPHVDGLSLLEQLAKTANHDIRFLVVTGDRDDRTDLEARLRGAHDVVLKPFRIDEILVRIRLALEP